MQQYQREEAFLQKYQDDLKSQESGLRKELAAIFQRNQDLARQLAEINRQLTIEIDRRTNAVAPPDEGSER